MSNPHAHSGHREPPGRGGRPGIEDQELAEAAGKPAQVPGTPGGPNADAFDAGPEAEELRPRPGEGPADPRSGPDDLLTEDDR